jgi:hypothetical protein
MLKDRIDIDNNKGSSDIALWHERLAALDAKYDLQQFIFIAMDLPENHPNLSIINRILDILDALRKHEHFT